MTTLLSWVGVDTHGPGSVYIASDSRISWGKSTNWDLGQKIYASSQMPEIFGFCGTVRFPTQILSQIITLIDSGSFFNINDGYKVKVEKVRLTVEKSYINLPKSLQGDLQIIYATRVGNRMRSQFYAAYITLNKKNEVVIKDIPLPIHSDLIFSHGSGKKSLLKWHNKWTGEPKKDIHKSSRTSRNVFCAFCDSLKSKDDKMSGGSPQLVGLYRFGPAKHFGIIYDNNRFQNGIMLDTSSNLDSIEWRNTLFEECNGHTMEILKNAQKQPRVR